MNHKPGSVTKNLRFLVLEFCFAKLQDRLVKAISDCHLSWTGLTDGLRAVYPQHWTGRPAAA